MFALPGAYSSFSRPPRRATGGPGTASGVIPLDPLPTASACPDSEVLQRLVLGRLTETEAGPLEEHLAHCDRCVGVLQGLGSGDALTHGLQEARAVAAALPTGTVVEGLMRRLRALPSPRIGSSVDLLARAPGNHDWWNTLAI